MKNNSDHPATLPDRLKTFRRLDLNLFIVFASIYDQGSITAAGKALGITQPAVSHALNRLRISLNDELFVRRGIHVAPTPFSKSIIDDIHQALDILRAGPLREKPFDPLTSTTSFRLSMAAGMEAFLLPKLLSRLSKEAPNVFITTTNVPREDTESELTRGELSLAIGIDPPPNLDIRRASLRVDELVTISRKGNPLTAKGLNQDTFLAGKHITIPAKNSGGGLEDFELAKAGKKRTIITRCFTVASALKSAAVTDYLVTLGRGQLEAIEPDHNFDVFEFPFKPPRLEALLLWHENVDSDPANTWLRNLVIELYK